MNPSSREHLRFKNYREIKKNMLAGAGENCGRSTAPQGFLKKFI